MIKTASELFCRLIPLYDRLKSKAAVRFLFVGAFNTLFGYSIFMISFYVFENALLSIIISTCLGVCFNYFTTGSFVFKKEASFIKFILAYILFICVNYALYKCIFYFIGLPYLSQAIALAPTVIMNYFMLKIFVYTDKNQ